VLHAPCTVEVIRPSSAEHEVRSLTRSGDDREGLVATR
jgi:hypothetical protein